MKTCRFNYVLICQNYFFTSSILVINVKMKLLFMCKMQILFHYACAFMYHSRKNASSHLMKSYGCISSCGRDLHRESAQRKNVRMKWCSLEWSRHPSRRTPSIQHMPSLWRPWMIGAIVNWNTSTNTSRHWTPSRIKSRKPKGPTWKKRWWTKFDSGS